MATILSRSSRGLRCYNRMSLCSSSAHLWRSAAAKSTIDPPIKLFSSISRVSDHQMVTARGKFYEVSSIFRRAFCSVPCNAKSAVFTNPVDSEKAPKISAENNSVEAKGTIYKFKEISRGRLISLRGFLLIMGTFSSLIIAYFIGKKERREEEHSEDVE